LREDLKAEIIAGTVEGAKKGEESEERWNHGPGLISWGTITALALSA
jgi:hypothetical protein